MKSTSLLPERTLTGRCFLPESTFAGRCFLPESTFAARRTRAACNRQFRPFLTDVVHTGRGKPRNPARQAGSTSTAFRRKGPTAATVAPSGVRRLTPFHANNNVPPLVVQIAHTPETRVISEPRHEPVDLVSVVCAGRLCRAFVARDRSIDRPLGAAAESRHLAVRNRLRPASCCRQHRAAMNR